MEKDGPQNGAQKEQHAPRAAPAEEDVPDPEEDDLDDLDGRARTTPWVHCASSDA